MEADEISVVVSMNCGAKDESDLSRLSVGTETLFPGWAIVFYDGKTLGESGESEPGR